MHRSPHHYTWALHGLSSVWLWDCLHSFCSWTPHGAEPAPLASTLDPGHLTLSSHVYVFIYIQHIVSSHWSTCRLKGIKHLAPHQSFIVRHSSDHTWAKGGLKTSWAENTGVSTAASRSYHAHKTQALCLLVLQPDSCNSEGFLKDYDCLTCTVTCSCSDSCRYLFGSNLMWAASQGL